MTTVVLRADGSAKIGTGHLRRCLTLARALQACGAEPIIITRRLDRTAETVLASAGVRILWLPDGTASPDFDLDAQDSSALMHPLQPSWVVVDHYGLDAAWHEEVGGRVGCRVAALDDLANRRLNVELVIDPNWHDDYGHKFRGLLPSSAQLLGGPHYALLDDIYRRQPRYEFNEQVRTVGIFLGGTDPARLSGHCIAACRHAGFQGPIEMVTTSANQDLHFLRQSIARDPQISLTLDEPDLSRFFATHDLQVGAGGGAAWERCYMGAPSIGLLVADNQLAVLPALERLGALRWVRTGREHWHEALAQEIRSLLDDPAARLSLSQTGRGLVDGWGAHRIAAWLCPELLTLHARPAQPEDEDTLLQWANDVQTRAASFSIAEISADTHHAWFTAKLADPDASRIFLLCTPSGLPIGQVRFDRTGAREWRINYLVAPELRGRGFGTRVLKTAADALAGSSEQPVNLWGDVKTSNRASACVFDSLGFVVSSSPPSHEQEALVFRAVWESRDSREFAVPRRMPHA